MTDHRTPDLVIPPATAPDHADDGSPCACPRCLAARRCGNCNATLDLCGHCRSCQWNSHQLCNGW